MDASFWIGFINIIIIDIVLSGDNAVVIGMASRKLPPEKRQQAVIWGTGGAVALRVILTALAAWVLLIPYLKAAGGLVLAWIAFKLLAGEEAEGEGIEADGTIWSAIKMIIIADFVMSLDNVLAVGGAAHGDFVLLLFGLGFSIPLLMFGSNLIANLMDRLPFLVYVGAGILAYTAGSMIIQEEAVQQHIAPVLYELTWVVPFVVTGLVLGIGLWWRRHTHQSFV